MSLQTYQDMKSSNLESFGEIPAHWETTQLKWYYDVRLGKMLRNDPATAYDTHEFYLRAANVSWEGIHIAGINKMWFSPREKEMYSLTAGDLIVSEGGDVGRAAIWEGQLENCYIQNAVHRVRGRKGTLNKFLYYWIYLLKEAGYIDLVCNKATIAHLTVEKFNALPLIMAPIEEQRAIVAFLEVETGRIDALIAKKRALIARLQEKRTALISHAVTKGIDETAVIKPSNIPWLGDIPAHWDVKRLKFLTKFFGGGTPSKENELYWDGNIPWVSPKDMKWDYIIDTQDHITNEALENSASRLVPPNTVLLVVRSGILKHTIPVSINTVSVSLNQDMKALVLNKELDHEYLALIIRGNQPPLLTLWRKEGATVESLEHEYIANTSMPIPPIEEQKSIVDHLKTEISKLDLLSNSIKKAVKKLEEYRTAVISAAVTGKIDVRSHQIM